LNASFPIFLNGCQALLIEPDDAKNVILRDSAGPGRASAVAGSHFKKVPNFMQYSETFFVPFTSSLLE